MSMIQVVKETISLIVSHTMTIQGVIIFACGIAVLVSLLRRMLRDRSPYMLTYALLVVYIDIMLLLLVPEIIDIINFIIRRLK